MTEETTIDDIAESYHTQRLLDSDELFVAKITDVGVTDDDNILLTFTIDDNHSYQVSISRTRYSRYADLCDAAKISYDQPYELNGESFDVIVNDLKLVFPTINTKLSRTGVSSDNHNCSLTQEYADAIKRRVHEEDISTATITSVNVTDDHLIMTLDHHSELEWSVPILNNMQGVFKTVVEEIGGGDVNLLKGSEVALRNKATFIEKSGHDSLYVDTICDPLTEWLVFPSRADAQKGREFTFDKSGVGGIYRQYKSDINRGLKFTGVALLVFQPIVFFLSLSIVSAIKATVMWVLMLAVLYLIVNKFTF